MDADVDKATDQEDMCRKLAASSGYLWYAIDV
jgi:hypothetical protein